MFFIYPSIVYILFASMQCFDSLELDEAHTPLSRMQIIPEVSCETEWYTQVYWSAVVPAAAVYCFFLPLFVMRSLVLKSHWIYHSGRD